MACELALRGALEAGREKEGELATMPLEFEYLHKKSRCELLIGGDDISNDVITLDTCFHVFLNVYIRARFRLALIGENLTSQSTGSHKGILETEFKFPRRSCKLFFLFPPRRLESAWRACSQATSVYAIFSSRNHFFNKTKKKKHVHIIFPLTNFPLFQMHTGMIPKGLG